MKAVSSNQQNTEHIPVAALRKKLLHRVGKAIADFSLIQHGDRIMVCLSGGKDSFVMLHLLRELQSRAPVRFELLATVLNYRGTDFPEDVLIRYCDAIGQPYHIIRKSISTLVRSKLTEGDGACVLCSRLRRGILYTEARTLGYNKIALGHHADDVIETMFLNIFFNGTLKAMPPVLKGDHGRTIVIRPLVYCREDEIAAFAAAAGFPVLPDQGCGLPINPQRRRVKKLVQELEQEFPGVRDSMLAALSRIVPAHLLDRRLYNFCNLTGDTDSPRQ